MKQINVAIIGTGWCGGIRTETAFRNPLVKDIYIAETNEIRLKEMSDKVNPKLATTDYRELLQIAEIDAEILDLVGYPVLNIHHFVMNKHAVPDRTMCHKQYAQFVKEAQQNIESLKANLELKDNSLQKLEEIKAIAAPFERDPSRGSRQDQEIRMFKDQITQARAQLHQSQAQLLMHLDGVQPINAAAFRSKFDKLISDKTDLLLCLRTVEMD